MIRYALKCDRDHGFESWFKSAGAYDALKSAGQVVCPECGSASVEKALMAPAVPAKSAQTALSAPASKKEAALAELRRHVEANSEYVGMNFAAEARKMHDGQTEARSIYGEARLDEAKRLIEDGVPVAPLPFTPREKTN
jgi:hypothetical protein